jgi:hypothetical protein
MTTNQQALSAAVKEVLPAGAKLLGSPSLYIDQHEVGAEVEGMTDEQIAAAEQAYRELTNYTLRLTARQPATDESSAPVVQPEPAANTDQPTDEPMEINAAYGVVRNALEPKGLQKVGLKNGELVLTFVSPQIGARYTDEMAALSQQTGYPMRVYENPMQNIILDTARSLLRKTGWTVQKGPGIHTDRGEVSVKIAEPIDQNELERVSDALEQETGYKLVLR